MCLLRSAPAPYDRNQKFVNKNETHRQGKRNAQTIVAERGSETDLKGTGQRKLFSKGQLCLIIDSRYTCR